MNDRFKTWLMVLGVLFLIVMTYIITKKIADSTTKEITTGLSDSINHLQKEIKWNNIKYIALVFEHDSILNINDSIESGFKAVEKQKTKYLVLYQKYKKAYLGQSGEPSDTIIVIDSIFGYADEVIKLQENQITQIQSINTNNKKLISDLKAQIDDQAWLMKSCDDLLAISDARIKKTEAKLAKVKNKRNLWIGIGIVEAVIIGTIIVFSK